MKLIVDCELPGVNMKLEGSEDWGLVCALIPVITQLASQKKLAMEQANGPKIDIATAIPARVNGLH